MPALLIALFNDEAGFIISGELILVSTIVVLSLVVGLSEVASAVNQELEDVGAAFGSVNQSFKYHGYSGVKGRSVGSYFGDRADECDSEWDITCDHPPVREASYHFHGYGSY